MKNKLAVFDLDGTLFDTDEVNYRAYRMALEALGYHLERAYFDEHCSGRRYSDFLPALVNGADEVERVHQIKKTEYKKCLGRSRVNEQLFSMISLMKEEYHIALVTTGSRKNCGDILEYFQKKEWFELIVCQEDVEQPKPNPEGILKAMAYFDIPPEKTVIFEDSAVGIEAGKRSGGTVLKVESF